jgi:Uncharacterised nucleotidyltransferase
VSTVHGGATGRHRVSLPARRRRRARAPPANRPRACPAGADSLHERAVSPTLGDAIRTLAPLADRVPAFDTIRTSGPARLRDELRALPGFERFPFRARYLGICDLCLHITSDVDAVAALRRRLVDPGLAAERRAAWLVIQDSRRRGELNAGHINGPGAARVFLRAASEPGARWTDETARILCRPDVDWERWASYLAACGLARPLVPALGDAELARWAPAFFTETLRGAAVREGIRELVQRDVLRRVELGLRSMGARGVLLKGMALTLRAREEGAPVPPRATGDIDLYVGPDRGPALRRRLLELGFRGAPDARPTSTHHLAPVTLQGILAEIHTRITAPHWGLPEREMLGRARPLASAEGIDTLDPEGLLLHSVVHCAQHCFSHGLRAGWDVLAVLRSCPDLDWERLTRWVVGMRAPRGFWVPAAVLSRELGLPMPPDFLRNVPRDGLERASRRWPGAASSASPSGWTSSTRSAGMRCCSSCTTRSAPAPAISVPCAAGP